MLHEDDIRRAETFVRSHGDILQQARMAALLHGTPPTAEALALWREGHQPDGGWASAHAANLPPGQTRGRSTLIATVRALRYGRELDVGVLPEVRGALFWLTRQQRPDSSFVDEQPVVSDMLDAQRLDAQRRPAPDNRMRAWATATVLRMLDEWIPGVQPYGEVRQRAYDWLMTHVDSWDTQYVRTVWLTAAAALRRGGTTDAEAVQLCAHLSLRLSRDDTQPTARDLADLASTLLEAGWPADESPVSRALAQLERMRSDDGAFADPLGREDVVESTIAAIRAYIAAVSPAIRR